MFETGTAGEYTAETEWNEGGYPHGESEDEWGRRRRRWRRRRWDNDDDGESQFPAEAENQGEDESEEQFLPALLPLLANVVPAVLGALGGGKREAETGYASETEFAGEGEGEEQFILGKLLKGFLGEAPDHETGEVLHPQQEAELAGRLLEVNSEDELGRLLGGIVNMVGRTVQGVQHAARSPQGRAVIEAVAPVVTAAMRDGGQGEIFESEAGGMSQEQEIFETARQAVRLAAATAQHVAAAPPGVPAELVGELGLIRAAGRFARPFVGRAIRGIFGRRGYGVRRGYRGYRGYGGYRGQPPWGYRGPRYGGYRGPRFGPRYGYGFPGYVEGAPPPPEPPSGAPEPSAGAPQPPAGPPAPGFRWVAVPIGAPTPTTVPVEPTGGPSPDAPPPPGPAQSEWHEARYGEYQPEYGQPEYGQPEYGQPEYGQPEYGGYGEYGRSEFAEWEPPEPGQRRNGKSQYAGA
jgi:hypothetical protein